MPLRFLVAALLAAVLAPSAAAQIDTPPVKFWVFFTDKQPEATRGAAPRRVPVTPHALERRARRGSSTRPAGLDVPVATPYVDRLKALSIEPVVESRWFNAVSAVLTLEQAETVRALPFVQDLRPVARFVTERTPPEPVSPVRLIDYGPSQLQLDLVNARLPIEAGFSGTNVIVGFLDTTFDFTHPALAPILASGRLLGLEDFTGQEQSNTHGLSVASIAVGFDGGDLVGPGFGAAVLAATTEYAPSETLQEEDFFVAGMEWMEANGADVVNVSLGYSTFDPGEAGYTYEDMDGNTTLVTRASDIAASLGIAVVTSAGNEGSSGWHFITAPADADSVITVGAVRADSTRASFSSFGPTADGRTKPDVVALGVGVVRASPGNGYGTGNGTSYSAPMVSGIVAQMLQANPNLNPIELRDVLRATASQPDAEDNERGWGVVNAAAAVQRAIILTGVEPGIVGEGPASVPNYVLRRGIRALDVELGGAAVPPDAVVTLFNTLGRRVAVFRPRSSSVLLGRSMLELSLPALPSGVYFYRITGDDLDVGARIVVQ